MAEVYYDTALVIVALILLGRFLEARAKGQTSESHEAAHGPASQDRQSDRDGVESEFRVKKSGSASHLGPSRREGAGGWAGHRWVFGN